MVKIGVCNWVSLGLFGGTPDTGGAGKVLYQQMLALRHMITHIFCIGDIITYGIGKTLMTGVSLMMAVSNSTAQMSLFMNLFFFSGSAIGCQVNTHHHVFALDVLVNHAARVNVGQP